MRSAIVVGLVVVFFLVSCAAVRADADVDNDGDFDEVDIAIFLNAWTFRHTHGAGWDPRADLNGDGELDWRDAQVFCEASVAGGIQGVDLTEYFISEVGAEYIWRDVDEENAMGVAYGTVKETPAADAAQLGDVQIVASDFADVLFWSVGWSVDGQGRMIVKSMGERVPAIIGVVPTVVPLAPPNGVRLPRRMLPGDQVSQQVDVQGQEGVFTLRLVDMDLRVVTPAGDFTGCVLVTLSLESNVFSARLQLWLAKGIGPVKWAFDFGQLEGTYVLHGGEVGGQSMGRQVRVATSGWIPCQAGQKWVWRGPEEQVWGCWRFNAVNTYGMSRVPIVKFGVNIVTSERDYWLVEDGYFCGVAGWYNGSNDYLLKPSGFRLPDEMIVGRPVVVSGTLQRDDNENYGTWRGRAVLLGTGQEVDGFSGCQLLWIQITPSDSEPQVLPMWGMLAWVKPGLGIVRYAEYMPQALGQEDLEYVRLVYTGTAGGALYGACPGLDVVDRLRLYEDEKRQYTSGEGGVVESVGVSDVIGGQPYLEVQRAGDYTVKRTYWEVGPDHVRMVGFMLDPIASGLPYAVKLNPPLELPRVLPMGQYVSHYAQLQRADSGAAAGSVWIYGVYAGVQKVITVEYPTAEQSDQMQWMWVVRDASGRQSKYTMRQLYARDLGLVLDWTVTESGGNRETSRIDLHGAKTRAVEFNWNFAEADVGRYWPYAAGNEWIFGSDERGYTYLECRALWNSGVLGRVLPMARGPYAGGSSPEVWYWQWPTRPYRIVGYKPGWATMPGRLAAPLTVPDSLDIGDVVQTRTDLVFTTGLQEYRVATEITLVPLSYFGRMQVAGEWFDDVWHVLWINYFDFRPLGRPELWRIADMMYGRDAGPLRIWERATRDDNLYTPGYMVYASVNGRTYGARP